MRSGEAGERAVLIDANLRGLDLRAVDLRGAILSDADLSSANLSGADWRHVEAWRANFKGSRNDAGELHTLLGCETP